MWFSSYKNAEIMPSRSNDIIFKSLSLFYYWCSLSNSKNWLDDYVVGYWLYITCFLRALDYGGSKLVEENNGIVLQIVLRYRDETG